MIFREMVPEDRGEMTAFFRDMGELSSMYFNHNRGNELGLMRWFDGETREHRCYWVVEEEGKILGYCFIWDTDSLIPWFGIAVRDGYHGKHIGTLMLSTVLEKLRNAGYGGLLLTTAQNNYKGQALYEKCGFERMGEHPSGEFLYLHRFQANDGNEKAIQ